jgi:hypothetical protein
MADSRVELINGRKLAVKMTAHDFNSMIVRSLKGQSLAHVPLHDDQEIYVNPAHVLLVEDVDPDQGSVER